MKKIILALVFIAAALAFNAKGEDIQRGYRGFVDWGNEVTSYEVLDWRLNSDGQWLPFDTHRQGYWYTGVTTSHGYQINRKFFVGAGLALQKCTTADSWLAPIFLEGRADLRFGKFTPYADLRVGTLCNGGGCFISPTIGYRLGLKHSLALNFALGMSYTCNKADYYQYEWNNGVWDFVSSSRVNVSKAYFTFRIGAEF